MTYQQIVDEYAADIVAGNVVACHWVKLAAKRYINDLQTGHYYFDENSVDEVVTFINKLNLNTTPKKPFILENWQLFIIANIYGLKSNTTNKRKYRYVYIEIPRKNGKSELITALAMYHFIFDQLPIITISANSREQAKNVDFKKVKEFAHQLDKREKYIIPYYNSLKMNKKPNEIIVTSSDSKRLDGLDISVGVIDELHSAKDSSVYDVIKSAMGARSEPLLIVITTAGFYTDSFCYKLRGYITDILQGVVDDEAQFGIIYTLDEGDNVENKEVWAKANPNLGVSLTVDFIENEVNKAQNSPSETAGVLVKNFNLWQKKGSEKQWLPDEFYVDIFKKIDLNQYKNAECYCGIDLGSNTDLTTFSLCFRLNNNNFLFFTKYYLPEDSLNSNVNKKRYRDWAEQGYITLTPGNVTDYDYILNDLLNLKKIVNIKQIHYDRYNATQFAIDSQSAGLRMLPFAQTTLNYNLPTKEFERYFLQKKMIIDANPITKWCLNNVVIKFDANGNAKPIKVNNENKIDGIMAMLMAFAGYVGKRESNVFVL